MKKLNNKGFTLVELLAVIVILAIIMVITIPTVLGSMESSKKKAFGVAVAAIQKYVDNQAELCKLGDTSITSYDKEIFKSGTCIIDGDSDDARKALLENTGYDKSIAYLTFYSERVDGVFTWTNKIMGATATNNSEFGKDVTYVVE